MALDPRVALAADGEESHELRDMKWRLGVLTEIDVKDTLKKKLGVDFRRYVILGACNPDLAHRALGAEAQIGLLLPGNVVVQEEPPGDVVDSIADPRVMFTLVENVALAPIADEADQRLRKVIASLQ
jgi:uncharacterized protein (DUF302 family)